MFCAENHLDVNRTANTNFFNPKVRADTNSDRLAFITTLTPAALENPQQRLPKSLPESCSTLLLKLKTHLWSCQCLVYFSLVTVQDPGRDRPPSALPAVLRPFAPQRPMMFITSDP